MADDRGQGGETQDSADSTEESKLELPSLRLFGRRKKKAAREEDPAPDTGAGAEPVAEPTAADPVEPPESETRTLPPVEDDGPADQAPSAPSGPAPTEERARRLPPVPPPPHPTAGPEPEPEPEEAPVDQAVGARDDGGRSLLESLRRGPGEPAQPRGERTRKPRRERKVKERRVRERAPREPITLPRVNPYVAAVLTGVVIGLVGVGLTLGTGRGCEAVRGVGSCGGFGLFALVVILAVQVILGAALLRGFRLADPSSTSFLGVGLAAVVVLLFFLSALDSLWMFLVVPALTAATMAFSWWLTSNFVERPQDDLTGSNLD